MYAVGVLAAGLASEDATYIAFALDERPRAEDDFMRLGPWPSMLRWLLRLVLRFPFPWAAQSAWAWTWATRSTWAWMWATRPALRLASK